MGGCKICFMDWYSKPYNNHLSITLHMWHWGLTITIDWSRTRTMPSIRVSLTAPSLDTSISIFPVWLMSNVVPAWFRNWYCWIMKELMIAQKCSLECIIILSHGGRMYGSALGPKVENPRTDWYIESWMRNGPRKTFNVIRQTLLHNHVNVAMFESLFLIFLTAPRHQKAPGVSFSPSSLESPMMKRRLTSQNQKHGALYLLLITTSFLAPPHHHHSITCSAHHHIHFPLLPICLG